jgi:hypothetical protein
LWAAHDASSDEILRGLETSSVIDDEFSVFWMFVDALARGQSGAAWVGACLELCLQGRVAGRIHAHAFISVDPSTIGGPVTPSPLTLRKSNMIYQNMQPHVRGLDVRGRRRGFAALFAAGMYYVLARKKGQLRVRGNVRPFQDGVVFSRLG